MHPTAQLLTPRGAGAVAVLEVHAASESEAARLLAAFSADPLRELSSVPVNRILFGRWRGEDIVAVRTSALTWELHCHGGSVAIERILSDLELAGARRVETSSVLTRRSLATEAELEEHLASVISQCRTRRTASLALAQSDGRLQRLWNELRSADSSASSAAQGTVAKWRHVAEHLIQPWRVALVGPPNAGKSSLMNTISGRNRAIVSDVPGTTRDLLEADVFLDGWPFVFVDSAGIRDAVSSDLEQSGIERSRSLANSADVVCLVVDQSEPPEISSLLASVRGERVCILLNKCDLTNAHPSITLPQGFPTFQVSASTGEGISQFLSWLVKHVIPEEPTDKTTLPIFPPAAC